MALTFWFEFGSTYSYPVAMVITERAKARGLTVTWRPFLLGPIFKNQGWADSPFNLYPAKGRYMWQDMQRLCQQQGLTKYQRPSVFPRNGLLASRIACLHNDANWLPDFIREVFRANFEHDHDIANPDVIASCLPFRKSETTTMIKQASSDQAKQLLRQNTDQAEALGIFGAPSFTVGKELFWGGDRLEMAFTYAKQNVPH